MSNADAMIDWLQEKISFAVGFFIIATGYEPEVFSVKNHANNNIKTACRSPLDAATASHGGLISIMQPGRFHNLFVLTLERQNGD